ncbi:MlaD family protein [Gordonia sp. DT219]|uniref:MlaD family protein n=1 Tax=Gordonia sp. DT219 TaxID=3416658 RepID=UPI003CF4F301
MLTAVVAMVLAVTGCSSVPGLTVEQIPLPAPGNLGDTMTLTASFDNALNLPSRAKVKLYGMDVGQVTGLRAENYKAIVTMDVSTSAKVPTGTGAELRQATPLGDVFVALIPPAQATTSATTYMSNGQALTGPRRAAATVEDLLVSMSGVVDSGSLGSTQQIIAELSAAVSTSPDNPQQLNGAIDGLTTALRKLNQNSGEVDTAMANTELLTGRLAAGRAQLMASINKLSPAFNTVNDEMQQILTTLDKTNQVTAATNDFLHSDGQNLVELIHHLATLLDELEQGAPTLGALADNVAKLTPKWVKSTNSSAAALSAKIYYLNPGAGFDSASRLPELGDVGAAGESLQQTLTRLLARLTATQGCCG